MSIIPDRSFFDTAPPADIAVALAAIPQPHLLAASEAMTQARFGPRITYSRKVFIPLTKLCRDVCHYCTFAETPRAGYAAYLSADKVLAIAHAGVAAGCREALFTLGDQPEARYGAARSALAEIATHVRGKIVVDTTVPLMPPKVMQVNLPAEGSAAVRAKNLLGDGVTLVSAFHNVAAHKLATDEDIACDVMVFGDDKAASAQVIKLVGQAGLRGLHGGALVNSAAAEALTSILIFMNKTYQVDGAAPGSPVRSFHLNNVGRA